ncbi:MAG: 3-deoxy-manno-octulosonate cytidylyltransferase [Bacteroidales bacterium]|nr:3-deoxy-manno-octulosonate cytidylyltransferase [Bacteroidales bacterium]
MNFLGIIPARYQSSRFPGKPLAIIDGKSMIRRVWDQASKVMDNVVVATDDQRIKDEVDSFGGNVVMTNSDHQSGTDRCAEAVDIFQKINGLKIDVVINIQGDEPFIDPKQISQLIEVFQDRNICIATLIKKITDYQSLFDPNEPKVVIDQDYYANYFSRACIPYNSKKKEKSWLKHHTYFKHIGMYGYTNKTLQEVSHLEKTPLEEIESLEQLRWLETGYRIKCLETEIDTLSVDSVADLENMREKGFLKEFNLP